MIKAATPAMDPTMAGTLEEVLLELVPPEPPVEGPTVAEVVGNALATMSDERMGPVGGKRDVTGGT